MAVTWEGEDGEVRRLTNAELKTQVDRAAGMLAGLGVGPGDRVGIFLPLLPETVIAVLALGRLGAIYTPIFSGYAAPAVASRLDRLRRQAAHHRRRLPAPRRGGAAEGDGRRGGRGAPTVERVLVVRRLGDRRAGPRAVDRRPRRLVGRGRWPTPAVRPLDRGARRPTPRRRT